MPVLRSTAKADALMERSGELKRVIFARLIAPRQRGIIVAIQSILDGEPLVTAFCESDLRFGPEGAGSAHY